MALWLYYVLIRDRRNLIAALVDAKEHNDDYGIAYYSGQLNYIESLIKRYRNGEIE